MSISSDLLELQLKSGGVAADASSAPASCRFDQPLIAHFGDAVAELHAARELSAVFDLSNRIRIKMTGQDAARFLHNFCTNDINRLTPGDGCEAFVTNAKGRILGHVFVTVTTDGIFLSSSATDVERLISHFDRYLFNENVQIKDVSDEFADLLVVGTKSNAQFGSLGIQVETLPKSQHTTVELGTDLPLLVQRLDIMGPSSYLLTVAQPHLVGLWSHLTEAGIAPAGTQAYHTLRIDARLPIYGRDISEDNLAQEAGRTEQAISFTKGCYLGQEPIARIDAIGHINRQLQRIRIDTAELPDSDLALFAGDGKEAGKLTSSMVVPGESAVVGLALLRSSYLQAGTQLIVGDRETSPVVAVY